MATYHAKSWCAAPEALKAPPIMGVSLGQSGATPLSLRCGEWNVHRNVKALTKMN